MKRWKNEQFIQIRAPLLNLRGAKDLKEFCSSISGENRILSLELCKLWEVLSNSY